MADNKIDKILNNYYYKPSKPAAFTGVDKLYKVLKADGHKIGKSKIRKWLAGQNVYTKHKPVYHKFKRSKVVVPAKYYQFDADTVSMTRYEKINKGFKYFLVIIDILSRYAWTHPLKSLTGKEMVKALKSVVQKNPKHFRFDGGSEFQNKDVKKYLENLGIHQFQTLNDKKANYVERLNKTIKSKLMKHMFYKHNRDWVDVLPAITDSYNNTYHRSIKMTPAQALKTDNATLWLKQYSLKGKKTEHKKKLKNGLSQRTTKFRFKVGDTVKLSYNRSRFDRAYDDMWTDENFVITERNVDQNIAQYSIKDYNNDPVKGRFYEAELQKVNVANDSNPIYKIEKILKKRTKRGIKEVLVKWDGWSSKFNSWIAETEVQDI